MSAVCRFGLLVMLAAGCSDLAAMIVAAGESAGEPYDESAARSPEEASPDAGVPDAGSQPKPHDPDAPRWIDAGPLVPLMDDCDPDPPIRPGAEEVMDGIDNDCDGEIDEVLVCTELGHGHRSR